MDVITYCQNTAALVAELLEKAPHLISTENDVPVFLVDKTPVVRRGNETMSLIRDLDGSLMAMADGLTHLTVLGTYDEVFADPDKRVIYDRVYDQAPMVFADTDGIERTHTPPEKFGVFPP